jgi:hypothetical protein
VQDASLQGITLRRAPPQTTATLRALPRGGRLQTNGAQRGEDSALLIHSSSAWGCSEGVL